MFFLSGSSSLMYQVIWTRMAFAAFGVIMPVLSVVLSVFMLGLSVGSWAGGRCIGPLRSKTGRSALAYYGLVELLVGAGAIAVPRLFALGKHLLLSAGQSDSLVYLVLSALVLAASILPWCLLMGTTFPFVMAYVRERDPGAQNSDSFSYLYLANVLGAMCGTLLSAFVLIEVLGFRGTLRLAAIGNLLIVGVVAWVLRKDQGSTIANTRGFASVSTSESPREGNARPQSLNPRSTYWLLFSTGFVSMAMEVVWTRAFAPVLKTQVYSFAIVVAAYLGATFHGSALYRRHLRRQRVRSTSELLALLSAAALLPVLVNTRQLVSPAWGLAAPAPLYTMVLLAGIWPFCALLGYLTPSLVDGYAAGSPKRAGAAYAVNVLGCILGPLFAAYLLLPRLSERFGLILLSLPFAGFYFAMPAGAANEVSDKVSEKGRRRLVWGLPAAGMLAGALFFACSYEDFLVQTGENTQVRRDYAATVISYGSGFDRSLQVNGYGMTRLTPCTKFMAHLPLALHQTPPESALIICFGMGTSFRAALSWGIRTTAVELVPGVRDAFGFYHADASDVLSNPKGRIVIDDGRRYLERTTDKYDVIVVDPPPPVETAGSSLLYSKEFYEVAKRRLNPGGIMQVWIPENATLVFSAALRTLCEAFPYVRRLPSYEGAGAHLLAAMYPFTLCRPSEFLSRLPSAARQDVLEWCSEAQVSEYLNKAFTQTTENELITSDLELRITDDRPFNEYFLVRRAVLR